MFAAKCLRYIPSLKAASKQSIGRCTCQKFAILHNNRTFAFAVKDQVEFDDFLSENQYFAKQNIGNEHAPNTEYCELDIGILGKELIRNWEAEWWKFIVMTNPMAVGISEEATIQCDECNSTKNTALALLKMDPSFSEISKDHPSKTIAAIVHESNPLLSLRKKLVVGIFTALSWGKNNYDLEFQNLRFIKKHLNKPQNLKLVQANTSDQRNIVYENFPNYCVQQSKAFMLSKEETKVGMESLKGTLISIDMNHLILTTLMDALDHRDDHHIVKLNPKLAPIKVIVLQDQSSDVSPTLQQLIEEICCMLRSKNISCWNGLAKNAHLEQADKLGIPFALIVPPSILNTGLLYLRMLTTTINMEVHITDVENLLTKYLRAS